MGYYYSIHSQDYLEVCSYHDSVAAEEEGRYNRGLCNNARFNQQPAASRAVHSQPAKTSQPWLLLLHHLFSIAN